MLASVPTVINFFGLGIVDRSVVLRGEENFLVARERFFQRAHGGFAADDERRHHLREDDHIAHRHHRHALHFQFFSVKHESCEVLPLGRLSCFFEQAPIDFAAADHVSGDDEVAHFALSREVIHQVKHQVFENHAQAARADFALQGQFGDGFQSIVGESQAHILKFEEPLVLT